MFKFELVLIFLQEYVHICCYRSIKRSELNSLDARLKDFTNCSKFDNLEFTAKQLTNISELDSLEFTAEQPIERGESNSTLKLTKRRGLDNLDIIVERPTKRSGFDRERSEFDSLDAAFGSRAELTKSASLEFMLKQLIDYAVFNRKLYPI